MKIYIGGISSEVTEKELFDLYSTFGKVVKVDLLKDPATNINRGYAFIEFDNEDNANSAILGTNNTLLGGTNIAVSMSRSRLDQKNDSRRQPSEKGFRPRRPVNNTRPAQPARNPQGPRPQRQATANRPSYSANPGNNRAETGNYNSMGNNPQRSNNRNSGSARQQTSFLGQSNFAVSSQSGAYSVLGARSDSDQKFNDNRRPSQPRGNFRKPFKKRPSRDYSVPSRDFLADQ